MKEKNLRTLLGKSIAEEKKAVKDRFEKADEILESRFQIPLPPPKQAEPPKASVQTFSISKADTDRLSSLKIRARRMDEDINKSELVRAGLYALDQMSDVDFSECLQAVPKLKPGRRSGK